MRYPASEKLEIIRVVEESTLPVRLTLEKIGIPRATFYRWYDLYQAGGPEALDDRHPKPDRVWNRIPDDVRERIIGLALDEPALSARELAVRFTDTEGYFVSGASVYRLLKAYYSSEGYLDRVRAGARRVDLEGRPAGMVAAEDEKHARTKRDAIRARRDAGPAAILKEPPQNQPTTAGSKRLSLADLREVARRRREKAP
jgi:hypothetical protein